MTFPNFPKRSSSDDEALDQALNAWAGGELHNRHSELVEESPRNGSLRCSAAPRPPSAAQFQSDLATDALEFHRWAEDTRRSDPAATGPAADTWNRVLRSTAQAKNRGGDMSSAALSTDPQSAIIQDVPKFNRQSISRYLHYAASLLIVFGVAFAGAFMAMQINQPGGSNGQFALFGQTESETCDVEPLSVDRVMEIVKNPYPFMENGPAGEPTFPRNPDDLLNLDHFEADDLGVELTLRSPGETPNDDDFDTATEMANAYLQCLIHGTRGQVWMFYSPADIQKDVLREFQVFAGEEEVRQRVAERVDLPAYEYQVPWSYYDYSWENVISSYTPANGYANEDLGLALHRQHPESQYDFMVTVGVSLEDAEGKQVFLTTGTGNILVLDREVGGHRLTVTIAKHACYDQWYVLPVSTY